MAKNKGGKPEFEFFSADIADPIGKYTQPKKNTNKPGNQKDTGYPDLDENWADVRVKGRYMAGTRKKQFADMRGYGAATKGRKFRIDVTDQDED
jgi:hypothetical protein